MFKFLKEKLKGAISQTAEEIEEKGETQTTEEPETSQQPIEETKETLSAQDLIDETSEEKSDIPTTEETDSVPEKKGFFSKLFKKEKKLEDVPEEELKEVPIEESKETASEEKKEEIKEKVEEVKEKIQDKIEKKETPTIQELAERKQEQPIVEEQPKVEPKPAHIESKPEEEKKSFFGKIKQSITTKKINEKQFDDLFWNLEIILLENNMAVEVIEKIKEDLKKALVDNPIARGTIEKTISDSLKSTLSSLFDVEKINLLEKAKEKKPLIICFVGINGSGKTTTIAKVVKYFQNNGKSVVLAAADTFRAAAIDQIQQHADNLGVKLIKHDYGSDPAAVAFDAVKHAEAKGIDIVLIDTAGRMHSNSNLMDEMEKIIRVANPDLKLFVGESITGNDCTEQAKKFNDSIGLDGIILSKADIDEKGGAAISISHVTGKPIVFLGVGQEYNDLKEFDSNLVLESLGL